MKGTPPLGARGASVVSCQLGDELALLDLASGAYYTLNKTGAVVWRGIRDGLPPGLVATRLAAMHAVELPRVRADVATLLRAIRRCGLWERPCALSA